MRISDWSSDVCSSDLKVKIKAYPCRERNGVVWTYMGPDAMLPPLPNMEWNLVPAENVVLSMRVQECNWLQAVEGELDSAHAPILHGRIDAQGTISDWVAKRDLRPAIECMRQELGLSIAARRVDRESVVDGKSVPVRTDPGGRP